MTSPDVMHPLSSPPLHIPGQVPRETDDDEADNVRSRYLNDVPSIPAVANLQIYAGSTPRRSFRRGHSSTEVSQGAVVDLREALELRGSGTSKGYEHGVSAGNEPYIPPTSKAPLLNPDVPIDLGGTGDKSIYVKLDHARAIFRPLEDYIVACFASLDGINTSFFVSRSPLPARSASEGAQVTWGDRSKVEPVTGQQASISELDGKTLLLGDFAENGSWWTGGRPQPNRSPRVDHSHDRSVTVQSSITNLKTPMINWAELDEFYQSVIKAGSSWESKWRQLLKGQNEDKSMSRHISEYKHDQWQDIGADLAEAQLHAQRTLLKATETILKRPGRPLKSPDECRFLLILLANPLLYSSNATEPSNQRSFATKRNGPGQHSGIIKRILGLLANLPNECHYHLVGWFSRFSEGHFRRMVDLVGSFVTYRLTRQHGGKRSDSQDPTEELIPSLAGLGVASSAQLHAALGVTGPSRRADGQAKTVIYGEDWQLRAAAKVMSLLFSANNNRIARRPRFASLTASPDVSVAPHRRAHTYSQMLPISDFYNTLLDYSDIIADFEAWESRRGRFSFCQYPFFYSIWAKIHILEYDARRQMEVKAREAFFNSIMGRKAISQYLVLKIRRDCLVEDSLRGVSENVGSGQEDIKKSLKIEFLGEEGVDAGGLRKEWFLLLVREVFDPHHGGSSLTLTDCLSCLRFAQECFVMTTIRIIAISTRTASRHLTNSS